MKLVFEINEQDAATIARWLETGRWVLGLCHLSVNLDSVESPNTHLWTGAHGVLRVTDNGKENP